MANFHKHPGQDKISQQTLQVNGDQLTVGLLGYKDASGAELSVTNHGDDLAIFPDGTLGDSAIYKIRVTAAAKAKKRTVTDRIVAINARWQNLDYFDVNFSLDAAAPGSGLIKPLAPVWPMKTHVDRGVWVPNMRTLSTESLIDWVPLRGQGSVHYFALDEDVVPNWFGVIVPNGLKSFRHVHLFFHPTPSQAGYKDANYSKKEGWSPLFHYMSDDFAAQFCAAAPGQVLIMPAMTTAAASNCGVLPARWESIFGQILGHLAAGNVAPKPVPVGSVVVSSFSSGTSYSYVFRHTAKLGGKLHGVVDFDGIISSYRRYSSQTGPPAIKFQQTQAMQRDLPALARTGLYPVPAARWGKSPGPYPETGFRFTSLQLHGAIPQSMMYAAALLTRVT